MYKCIISHSGKTAPFVIISVVTVAVLAGQIIFIPNISNADEVRMKCYLKNSRLLKVFLTGGRRIFVSDPRR